MTEKVQYLQEWGTDGKDRKVYKVPAIFYADHVSRECGITNKIINRNSKIITVELDYAGYTDLFSDADYYWECRDEVCDVSLAQSAKRTMQALTKIGAPAKVSA